MSAGATTAEIVDVLVGVIPVVGLPAVVATAPKLALALGYDTSEATMIRGPSVDHRGANTATKSTSSAINMDSPPSCPGSVLQGSDGHVQAAWRKCEPCEEPLALVIHAG